MKVEFAFHRGKMKQFFIFLNNIIFVCLNSVNTSTMKAAAFDTTFINALSLKNVGGAYGGADFSPYTKSDTEIQVSI